MVVPNTSIYDHKRITSSSNSNCSCPYVQCCDSDTDDNLDKYLQGEHQTDNSALKQAITTPDSSPQKPRGILVRHESEEALDKKSKSKRTVSFTLEDSKKPFTKSIYYGVKSYLHHFYEPLNKTTANGDSNIDDDFEFVVEPGRRRYNYWVTTTLVLGMMMMLGSIYPILVRALTSQPSRDPWQLFGLAMFSGGSLLIISSLLISAYLSRDRCFKGRDQMQCASWDAGNSWIRRAEVQPLPLYDNRIPLSEEVTAPQMNGSKK